MPHESAGFIITEISRVVMRVKGLHIYVQKIENTKKEFSHTQNYQLFFSWTIFSLFYRQIRGGFLSTDNMEGSSVGFSGSALYSEDIMLTHPCL